MRERAGRLARKVPIPVLVALIAIGWVITGTLDASLVAMHRPGMFAGSATDVTSPVGIVSPDGAMSVIEGWVDWQSSAVAGEYRLVEDVLWAYVVTDIALLAVPVTVLLLGLLRRAQLAAEAAGAAAAPAATSARNAWSAAATFLVADILEDALLLAAFSLPDARSLLVRAVGSFSAVKWAALLLAAVSLVYAIVGRARAISKVGRSDRRIEKEAVTPSVALRAPIAVVALLVGLMLFVPGDVGRQIADVVLSLPYRRFEWAAAVVGSVGLAIVLLSAGLATSIAYLDPPPPRGSPLPVRRLTVAALAAALVVVSGGAVPAVRALWPVLIPLVGGFAVFLIISRPPEVRAAGVGVAEGTPRDELPSRTKAILRLVAIAPVFALTLALLRGSATLWVGGEGGQAGLLFLMAVPLAVVAWALHNRRFLAQRLDPVVQRGVRGRAPRPMAWAAAALVLTGIGAALPQQIGRGLGPLGVLFAFASVLVAGATALALWGDRHRAPGILAYLGMTRTPYLAMVGVVFVTASFLNRTGTYHAVEMGGELEARPVSLDWAFDAWVNEHAATGTKSVPMLFLATSGGGIRSAYWTALVLDCLSGRTVEDVEECESGLGVGSDFAAHVFAASGISGGSVGLAAHLDSNGPAHGAFEGSEFLGPVVAALAFRDAPNALLHLDIPWADRARILEMEWERVAPSLERGLSAASLESAGVPRFPLLLMQGATVNDGCRLVASMLDLANRTATGCTDSGARARLGRTYDLFDYSCGNPSGERRDVRLSTAALLSARFPYVSPTGGLTSCSQENHRIFVVDGGLIESSGAQALHELWTVLVPRIKEHNETGSGACIEPRLLLLDNGYTDDAAFEPPGRPQELLAPLDALGSARAANSPAAQQAVALAFRNSFRQVAPCASRPDVAPVAHVRPALHPGPLAPLGWSLSPWSEADLRAQLSHNHSQLMIVGSWFD